MIVIMIDQKSKLLFSCCHHIYHFKSILVIAFLNMNGYCLIHTQFYINLVVLVIKYGVIISAEGK